MTHEPHIPGQNARPPEGSIAAGWDEGLRLYGAGFFWEAHEAWEPVWMDAPTPSAEREMVQGAIQLANARLKLVMGREKAAAKITVLAAEHLRAAGEHPAALWGWGELESLESRLGLRCAL